MVIKILLRDGRLFEIEAGGKDIGHLAERAATQTDEHREKRWTLMPHGDEAGAFHPDVLAEEKLAAGATYELLDITPPVPLTPLSPEPEGA